MVKKLFASILIFVLILNGILITSSFSVHAKTKKVTLNKKNVVLSVGGIKTVKLKNTSKKVRWKILKGKKNIRIIKKSGKCKNNIKLKGKKPGKAVIQAKHGKKTYKVKITVRKKKTKKTEITPQVSTVKPKEEEISEKTEAHITGKILNDGLTTEDSLLLEYYYEGPENVWSIESVAPQKLEIYSNGEWIEIEHKDFDREGAWPFTWNKPLQKDIHLTDFNNVKPGHYKYTELFHLIQYYGDDMFNGKIENTFTIEVPVEFDVTSPEFLAMGQLEKNELKNTDSLEITYMITVQDEKYTYDVRPGYIKKYTQWDTVEEIIGFINPDYNYCQTMTGSCSFHLTLPIKECFGELKPGKYKYVVDNETEKK